MTANGSRFTEIVARERSRVGSFIRGQVRDAAEAEDILQDVWLEFFAATDAIEQAGAWLFRVARNRIIDRARKKREEPLPDAGDDGGRSWLEENLPDPAAGPDAAYARSVLLGSIQAALQTLPSEQRDVFLAHEIEGISFADLSAQWRVPQNTLLARKRYAVLGLRLRLRAEYGDLIVWRAPTRSFLERNHAHFPARPHCSRRVWAAQTLRPHRPCVRVLVLALASHRHRAGHACARTALALGHA